MNMLENRECNSPDVDAEITALRECGQTMGKPPIEQLQQVDAKAEPKRYYTLKELSLLPAPKWQVKKHITQNSLNIMFGESGQYKSFAALDMALSIASGVPFIENYPVTKGKVVYLASEGAGGIKKRAKAWLMDRELDETDDFILIPESFDFTGEDRAKEVVELIGIIDSYYTGGIDFLVIDTVARNFGGGDENGSKDMGTFIKSLDALRLRYKCSVMGVHHCGKDHSKGARGHNSLRGACDTIIEVSGSGNGCKLSCVKQKDFEPFKDYILNIKKIQVADGLGDEDEEDSTSLVLKLQNGVKTELQLLDKTVKSALVAVYADHKNMPVTIEDVVKSTGKSKSTVYDYVKKWKAKRLIKVEPDERLSIGMELNYLLNPISA